MAIERNGNGSLPQELVQEILVRLPVKILSRCKCVSKNWCSLIESSSFVSRHFESSQERLLIRLLKKQDPYANESPIDDDDDNDVNEPVPEDEPVLEHEEPIDQEMPDQEGYVDENALVVGEMEAEYLHMLAEYETDFRLQMLAKDGYKYALYVDGTFTDYEEPIQLQIPDEASDVFGPLNGVFCVVTQFPWGPMALVNPALRQFKPLPLVEWIEAANNCFYNDELGLGLDPLTGDFKLVLLLYFFDMNMEGGDYDCVVSVCNSESDSWRVLQNVDSINLRRSARTSLSNTFINGSYYWLLDFQETSQMAVLAFDMGTEKFREIKVTGCVAESRTGFLTLCGDSLAVLMYDVSGNWVDIWLMVNEGFWYQSSRVGPLEGIKWPLCFWKTDELLFETMATHLTQYNVNTLEVKTIETKRADNWSFSHWIFVYKESLVSIKGKTGKCRLWDTSDEFVSEYFSELSSDKASTASADDD